MPRESPCLDETLKSAIPRLNHHEVHEVHEEGTKREVGERREEQCRAATESAGDGIWKRVGFVGGVGAANAKTRERRKGAKGI